ncbi:MAG: peptidase modulator of gyrase [Candidatus Aminicenantes bacterium]|nr:peptidase modulator of gyrase [Candidatus Aminicenantes bacterium]
MKEKKEYMDLAALAVDAARKAGADAAEACISDTESVQIDVSGRQVETVNAVREAGIGVRVLKDQKLAFGSTNELSRKSIQGLVQDLMKKVVFHTPDEFNVIAGKEAGQIEGPWAGHAELVTYDPRIAEVTVQEKIKRAIELEASALDTSPKVVGSMITIYQDATSYIYLANSNGIAGWFPAAGCGGVAMVSAAEGDDHQSGSYSRACVKYADFDPVAVGRKAGENAVRMLGAKPIASMEVPLVVAPEMAVQILSFIVGMLSADEVQKGRSLFAGKIDGQVAAPVFNLIDDGRLKGGLATAPVDGEGVPMQTTPLIVDGVLKTYLFDSYCAKKGKTKSTGNRTRSGYGSAGGIGSTNLYLKPGDTPPESIMGGIDRGLYLTEAIGLFAGIDSASGDFSLPSAGFMIEEGKLAFPVRGISIGGNLFELLKAVDTIGSDLTWFQAVGSPTFSVKTIKIGGAG